MIIENDLDLEAKTAISAISPDVTGSFYSHELVLSGE